MMENKLIYSRPTKHWTTVMGIISGFMFFIVGLAFILLQYKRVSLLVFGIIFSIMGFLVLAHSIDAYFIRPGLFIFQIEQDKISWGIRGRTKEILFHDLKHINFEVMNGVVGDITFKLDNGDVMIFNNHNTKLLSEVEMLEAFKFVNIHFEGKTLLNNV